MTFPRLVTLRWPEAAAAVQPASFLFGQAAPDAGPLAAGQGPVQAGGADRAAPADELGHLDLDPGGPDVVVREEQLGVGIAAGGVAPPVRAVAGRPCGRRGYAHAACLSLRRSADGADSQPRTLICALAAGHCPCP